MSISIPPIRFNKPVTEPGMSSVTFAGHSSAASPAAPADAFTSGSSTPTFSQSTLSHDTALATAQLFQALYSGDQALLSEALTALKDKTPIDQILNPETRLSPLITAASLGDVESTQKLLNAGASVYSFSPGAMPVSHVGAVYGKSVSLLQTLQAAMQANALNIKDIRDHEHRNALHDMARLTAMDGSDADKQSQKALIQWLTEQGLDLNARDKRGLTPYLTAVGNGNVRMMKALQAAGADVRLWKSRKVLDEATQTEIDAPHMTSLHWAAGLNQGSTIKHLLSPKNADVQQLNPNVPMPDSGNTPLHLAIEIPNVEQPSNRDAIEALLARGADWHTLNQAQESPWMWAQKKGQRFLDSLSGLPMPASSLSKMPTLPVIQEVTTEQETQESGIDQSESAVTSPDLQGSLLEGMSAPNLKDIKSAITEDQAPKSIIQPPHQGSAKQHSAKKVSPKQQSQQSSKPAAALGPKTATNKPQAVPTLENKRSTSPNNPFTLLALEDRSDEQPASAALTGAKQPKSQDASNKPTVPVTPDASTRSKKKKKANKQPDPQTATSRSSTTTGNTKTPKGKPEPVEKLDEIDQALMELEGRTTNTRVQTFDQIILEHKQALKLMPGDQQMALVFSHLTEQNINAPYFTTEQEFLPPGNKTTMIEIMPLHTAIQGPLPLNWITRFMKLGANPLGRDGLGRTPYHYAALWDTPDYLEALAAGKKNIRAGKQVSLLQDSTGATPLHYATREGRLANAEWLLKHGVPINTKTNEDETALLQVARTPHTQMVPFLLSQGANPEAKDKLGYNALHLAVRFAQDEMQKTLLSLNDFNVNATANFGSTPLHLAIANQDYNSTLLLLEHGANVNQASQSDTTPLQLALILQNPRIAQVLLEHGADPNKNNNQDFSPMQLAACLREPEGCFDILRILIAKGAKVDSVRREDKTTPLMQAVLARNMMAVSILLANGADVTRKNKLGENILHQFMNLPDFTIEDLEFLSMLLDKCPEEQKTELLNGTENDNQFTPLHIACDKGKILAVDALLKHGADPRVLNVQGENILHAMMMAPYFDQNSADMLNKLLNHSRAYTADMLNQQCNLFQNTPLHLAIANGKTQATEAFLNHGADTRLVNCAGKNAMHTAVDNIHLNEIPEIVISLLELPKDVVYDLLTARTHKEGKEKKGKTAFDIARLSPSPVLNVLIADILKSQLETGEPARSSTLESTEAQASSSDHSRSNKSSSARSRINLKPKGLGANPLGSNLSGKIALC